MMKNDKLAIKILVAAFVAIVSMATAEAQNNECILARRDMDYCETIGEEYGICPELLMAIAEVESGGNPNAKNGSCKGLMQVSTKWHKERIRSLGVTDIYEPSSNILVAADYLGELFTKYVDTGVALMIYNGDSNAKKYAEGKANLSKYATKVLKRCEELERMHGK